MKHILANGEPFLLKRGALEKDVLEELENIPSKTSDLTNDNGFVNGSKIYVGTCTTAAATPGKEATVETFPLDSDDKPEIGTVVAIKYSNSNSYNTSGTTHTLNVNLTGAYPIYYNNAEVVSTTSANTIACGYENRYTYYVFNGTQWVWLGAGMEYDDSALSNRVSTLERAGYITKQATYVRLNVDRNDVLTFQDMNGNSISIATFQTLLFDDSKEVILVDDYLGSKYDVDSYFRLSSIEYRLGDDYEARFNCESFDGHMYSTCLQYKEDGGFFVSSRCLEYSPPIASTSSPLIDGTATAGNSIRYAREDHVHPSTTKFGKKSNTGFKSGVYNNGNWIFNVTDLTPSAGILYFDVETRKCYVYDGNGYKEFYTTDAQVQADWEETDDTSMAYIWNKPALVGTVTGISVNGGSTQQPINGTVNLTVATGGNTDIVDISDGTANDGSIIFTQRNGDTITLNLNHNHSQYVTASDLGSIPRIDASSTANETTVTIEGTTHTLATASQSITIDAGKYYDFGTRTTLTIFPKEQTTDSTKVYSYTGRFTIDSSLSGTFSFSMLALRKNNSDTTIEGSNAFSFKLPEEVEFEAGNTYEFNILYDICVIKDITVSA